MGACRALPIEQHYALIGGAVISLRLIALPTCVAVDSGSLFVGSGNSGLAPVPSSYPQGLECRRVTSAPLFLSILADLIAGACAGDEPATAEHAFGG